MPTAQLSLLVEQATDRTRKCRAGPLHKLVPAAAYTYLPPLLKRNDFGPLPPSKSCKSTSWENLKHSSKGLWERLALLPLPYGVHGAEWSKDPHATL